MKFALLMKFPVLHAEPDCSPARATRCGGTGAAVWLCSAVWLGNNGIWLQSGWHDFLQSGSVFGCSLAVFGCFWPPFSPFCLFGLQSGSVVFAVWLFFVAVWLFLASQTARAEPDCKTTEPDCKSGSQTAKKKSQTAKKLQSGSLQSGYTTRVVGCCVIQFIHRLVRLQIIACASGTRRA